ncbi:MAG TPA: hypothetical protein VJM34_16430 [Novosphingobium sp.]|nr:hypothetical protein [Novosphingobium sp.]
MTIPGKRYRVTNLKLNEISSVDNPAQAGAICVLIKSAQGVPDMNDTAILKSATAVVERNDKPAYGSHVYEEAMFRRADELAKDYRTTPEQALVKGLTQDKPLQHLTHACEAARVVEYGQRAHGRGGIGS